MQRPVSPQTNPPGQVASLEQLRATQRPEMVSQVSALEAQPLVVQSAVVSQNPVWVLQVW